MTPREGAVAVSVIIPLWNGVDIIGRCLTDLTEDLRTSGLTHEIIVVDDESRDDGAEFVRTHFPHVTVLRNARNSGFSYTVNRGLRQATGEYLLLLNSDASVHQGTLRHMVEFMRTHPQAGGAGCRVQGHDGTLERTCREFPNLPKVLRARAYRALQSVLPRFAAAQCIECWPHDTVRSVDWIHMMFFMISRRAYEVVGPLDERFFMYGEDADYGWRLKQAGFDVLYTPDASVSHASGFSGNRRWGAMAVVKRQFALHQLLRKWYSPPHVVAFRAASVVLIGGQLVLAFVDRLRGRAGARDVDTTAALLKSNMGLLRPADLMGPRFDQHERTAA